MFVLNRGAKKIALQPWFSLFFNSDKLCAEPKIKNFFLTFKFLKLHNLLNEGIYTPSKFNFFAIFMLLEIKNFLFSLLQKSFIFFI